MVFNRLRAAQLEDRVFLIKDESRDRRPTVQALRAQAAHLQASEPPRQLARQRAELAASIDRIEAEIDAGHHALFRVDDSINRCYADVLTELIGIEDRVEQLPRVRGLGALVSAWSPQTVGAVSEQCAALAHDWLPSNYEGSPLAVLKRFDAEGLQYDEFKEDFENFCGAEARHAEIQAARNVPFQVIHAAAARQWLSRHRDALEFASSDTLRDFSRWIGARDYAAGTLARLEALRRQLDMARHQADKLQSERLRLDKNLYSTLKSENEAVLNRLRCQVEQVHRPARTWFSLGRYLARRRVIRYLRQARDASTEIDFSALQQVLGSALSEIGLRREVAAIAAELHEPPLSKNDDALGNVMTALSQRLAAAAAMHERLADCPNARVACEAASAGEPLALQSFVDQLAHAATLAEARDASLDALEALCAWFEQPWIDSMRAKVAAHSSTIDDINRLKAALPALGAFQRFRARAVTALPESFGTFKKLRSAERALRAMAPAALGPMIAGIINREARLAWKSTLEQRHPELLSDRDTQANQIGQLELQLNRIRSKNRDHLREGIDRRRTRFDEQWQRLVLLQGPNALGLRQIVERGIEFGLLSMRPVWLMNPDVASRALPLTAGLFDIVVFDEASQIPVENALPALFRGKQVIVSGDEKQLPPTSFFANGIDGGDTEADATLEDDASEEERLAAEQIWTSNEIKDAPDLLHLARVSLPEQARVMLKVHYRSEWKELIAFSNAAFYGGVLSVPVVRPDALVRREQPIRVHRVDGLYGSQTNPEEARAVVETVAEIWRASRGGANPRPTTGVVTFNLKQADLIADMMADLRRRDADFAADFDTEANRMEAGADQGFFVKNLENVQGDERDIIIFSTTFGVDANGTFRRNFGVLGHSGGERRLNVATTRARGKMIIATSMPVDRIADCLAKRKRPETPRDFLQLYLHYAELVSSGQLQAARALLNFMPQARSGSHGDEHSGFADIVGAFLEARGVRAVSLRDGSAFAMDFAIEDPESGNFCLGIECDAPWHPLLAAARARELWRPQILDKAIPAIHRVSLRGWLAKREQEQERLLHAIDVALRHQTFEESAVS